MSPGKRFDLASFLILLGWERRRQGVLCGIANMDYVVLTSEAEDQEEDVRILNDQEFSQALRGRNDIFLIESENRLGSIEAVALVLGAIFGIWFSTAQVHMVSPVSFQNILNERPARLLRRMNPESASKEESQMSKKEVQEERTAKGSNRALSEGFSIADYGKKYVKNGTALPRVKIAVRRIASISPKGQPEREDRLANRDNAEKTEDEINLLNIGNANKTHGNRADAFSAFGRVLKKNPHNTSALAGMGDLYLYTGILDSAASFYTAALAENPRIASVHNGLGSVRYYLSVMAANPNFVALRKIKDPANYVRSQYDSAIAEYTEAFSLDSSKVDALTNRGVIRDISGDHASALADYTRALRIKPTYAEAYSKRAATNKALGKLKEALADYTSAIKLDTGSYEFDPALHFANAYFGRGNVEFQLGNYKMAIADFDSTLTLSPHHSIAMLNKARALVDEKQYDSAVAWYSEAITTLSPTEYGGAQERAYFGRGVAYNLTNRPALALKDFNVAILLKPDDPYSHFHRGNSFKALGQYQEAIADYTIAHEYRALAAKACWRIAECYALQLDKASALEWLRKSISSGFKNPGAWAQDNDLDFLKTEKEFRNLTKQP